MTNPCEEEIHFRNRIQGVTRLISASSVRTYIKGLCLKNVKYLIVTEESGTVAEHVHFLIESDDKALNVFNLRKTLKAYIKEAGKEPKDTKYLNGMLNISKVLNIDRMVSYILKHLKSIKDLDNEVLYYCWAHGYTKDYLKACLKASFVKKISMTKAIHKLKDTMISDQIGISEYILEYRQLRNRYLKPDPLWRMEMERAHEIKKNKSQMENEIEMHKQELATRDRGY